MCKISIIVPVYNVSLYLEECLNSLVNQTLSDIEILCFDDCSTDDSGSILDRYAQKDAHVKVVHYPENKTAAQARKDGALMAAGEYIMYIDGDDRLALNACEELAEQMDFHQVDMIHFGTTVMNDGNLPEFRIQGLKNLVKPYHKTLRDADLLHCCFIEEKFHFQIWNKIYRASVVKQALACFPDGAFPKAQDLFAFYLIAYFARSYMGLPQKSYYFYGFGRGVTGHTTISRPTIDRYADQALIVSGIADFLDRQGTREANNASLQAVKDLLFGDSMNQLLNHVAPDDVPYAFTQMCEKWGASAVIGFLADRQVFSAKQWAENLLHCTTLAPQACETKCIGTFYHSLRNGGAQRVVASLAQLWVKSGYRVVLFTDSEPTNEDYPLPASVTRVVLPEFSMSDPSLRRGRCKLLFDSIKAYHVDLFIHHAWLNPSLLWDMLCVQSAGSLFYVHTHSVFSMALLSENIVHRFFDLPSIYSLANGIITLSGADEAYWKHFNGRTFTVKNPLTFDPRSTQSNDLRSKTVLWVGRLSSEKNPVHAVEIFAQVHQQHPDAKLQILGDGDANLKSALQKAIEKHHLQSSVELCGFQLDTKPYYQQASVFLCTSAYEGYSLTIIEAQSHGVPCVVYDMPYLSVLETGKGSFSVAQGNIDGAARFISKLFSDSDLLQTAGQAAKENVIAQCTADFGGVWTDIIASTRVPAPQVSCSEHEGVMLQTLLKHMEHAIKNKKATTHASHAPEALFAETPTKGPFRVLRRKLKTCYLILKQEGFGLLARVIKEKISRFMK